MIALILYTRVSVIKRHWNTKRTGHEQPKAALKLSLLGWGVREDHCPRSLPSWIILWVLIQTELFTKLLFVSLQPGWRWQHGFTRWTFIDCWCWTRVCIWWTGGMGALALGLQNGKFYLWGRDPYLSSVSIRVVLLFSSTPVCSQWWLYFRKAVILCMGQNLGVLNKIKEKKIDIPST